MTAEQVRIRFPEVVLCSVNLFELLVVTDLLSFQPEHVDHEVENESSQDDKEESVD